MGLLEDLYLSQEFLNYCMLTTPLERLIVAFTPFTFVVGPVLKPGMFGTPGAKMPLARGPLRVAGATVAVTVEIAAGVPSPDKVASIFEISVEPDWFCNRLRADFTGIA